MDDIILDNPAELPIEQMNVLLAGLKLIETYQPRRYSGSVAVYTARYPTISEALKGPLDPSQGWEKLAGGEVKVHIIDCAHRNIHLPPYCYRLAEKIEEELRQLDSDSILALNRRLQSLIERRACCIIQPAPP